jgi:hypothetical protein
VVAPDLATVTAALNDDLDRIGAWADSKNLVIAPEKSSVTLFTPDPHQHKTHPQVLYKGCLLSLVKNPKNLGITSDPSICYGMNASLGTSKGWR